MSSWPAYLYTQLIDWNCVCYTIFNYCSSYKQCNSQMRNSKECQARPRPKKSDKRICFYFKNIFLSRPRARFLFVFPFTRSIDVPCTQTTQFFQLRHDSQMQAAVKASVCCPIQIRSNASITIRVWNAGDSGKYNRRNDGKSWDDDVRSQFVILFRSEHVLKISVQSCIWEWVPQITTLRNVESLPSIALSHL